MNRILIFGTGNTAKKITEYIDKRKNVILYYVDNDTKKQGKKLLRKTIVNQDIITDIESDYIIIASVHWREIRSQLVQIGIDTRKIRTRYPMSALISSKENIKIYITFLERYIFFIINGILQSSLIRTGWGCL